MGKNQRSGYSGNNRNATSDKNRRSGGNDNRGYNGEPAVQHISSRERNYSQIQMEQMGPRSQTAIPMQPMRQWSQPARSMQPTGPWGQTHIPMQPMGPGSQTAITMQPVGILGQTDIPMQPMGPGSQSQPLGHQMLQQAQHVHHIRSPGNQYMVRDETSPVPLDKANTDQPYSPPMWNIIYKRIISTIFILLDIFLNWIQYASWTGNFEGPDWLKFLETANSLKGSPWKVQCSKGSASLTKYFTIFISFGTAYGCVRMVNMFGETLLEYQKQNPPETSTACKGFQIIHGWVETLLDLLIDDLPQAILLVVFSYYCHLDYNAMAKLLFWTIFKSIKNNYRMATCKQKYKPCCDECNKPCCDECCKEPCCDDCCKCCREPCCKDCCPCCDTSDCFCNREGGCLGEIKKDPDWAAKGYENVLSLYYVLIIAIVVLIVLKAKNILSVHQ